MRSILDIMSSQNSDPFQLKRHVKINYHYYSLNFTLEEFWDEIKVDPYIAIKNLCRAYDLKYKMNTEKTDWFGKEKYLFFVEIKALNVELHVVRSKSKEAKRIAAVDIFHTYRRLIVY